MKGETMVSQAVQLAATVREILASWVMDKPADRAEAALDALVELAEKAAEWQMAAGAEAQHADEVQAERDAAVAREARPVCSNCGADNDGDGTASDCCSCDIVPASELQAVAGDARKDADDMEVAWNAAVAIAEEAERERDEYRAANESVAVCVAHTTEVTRGDCLVCAVEEANSRAAKLEAALTARLAGGHNDTCDSELGDYLCNCGQDKGAALLVSAGRDEQETT